MSNSSRPPLAVALLAGVLAACSNAPATPKLASGQLAAGVAEVSVDGGNAARLTSVSCIPDGWVTTIVTGTADKGTTSTVKSAERLDAQSIELRDVDGFTGSYWRGLGEPPEVTMLGRTYLMTGTAMGFSAANPSARKAATFSIRVSC